jgi:glycosyltransferase involved in cell wall biosynthesis
MKVNMPHRSYFIGGWSALTLNSFAISSLTSPVSFGFISSVMFYIMVIVLINTLKRQDKPAISSQRTNARINGAVSLGSHNLMKAVWINPCFLHYRIPVYKALSEMLDNNLTVIFSAARIPEDVKFKIKTTLGERAVALEGEKTSEIGRSDSDFANAGLRIPFQPGLFRTISDVSPDVIIAEGFFQWTPAALWAKLKKKIPIVIAYERTAHTERNAGIMRTLYRRMVARLADAVCCNGTLSREYCIDTLGIPPERIVTGAMAADTDKLSEFCASLPAEEMLSLEKRLSLVRPVFLYVGRLIRLKGLRELLKSWELYAKNVSTCGSLLLVGDGPERSILEKIITDRKLPNVVFTGSVDYDKIAPYYALSNVFVIPTLEDNWSLVVPEAMACRKPILCSSYNGCWPELVHEDINGWVFDPEKPEELAGLFSKCQGHMDMLGEMGNRSAEIVRKYTPTCC